MRRTPTTPKTAFALVALTAVLLMAPAAGAQECPAPTADQLIFDQMSFIATLDIPGGIQNMLYVELQAALAELAQGDTEATIEEIEDFIGKVENQSGKQLTVEDADVLLGAAQAVIGLLTPPAVDCTVEPNGTNCGVGTPPSDVCVFGVCVENIFGCFNGGWPFLLIPGQEGCFCPPGYGGDVCEIPPAP